MPIVQLLVLASLVSTGFYMGCAEPVMEVLSGAETASKLSYRYDAGNVVSADRHVFQFDLELASPLGWAEPLASEPLSENFFTTGTVYRRAQQGHPDGWYGTESPPVYFQIEPAGSGFPSTYIDATQVVPNGQNIPLHEFSPMYHSEVEDGLEATAQRPGRTSYEFFILSPGESGVSMYPATVPVAPNGPLVTALGKEITPEEQIPCHLAAIGPLAGDEVRVLIKTTKTKFELIGYQDWFLDSQPGSGFYPYVKTYYLWKRTTSYHYALMIFDIQKLLCEDASIDSRRMHGVPNAEGQLPGEDPNAEHRNLNFNPWFFKGGLFIGKMGLCSGDQSGTARIQLYADGVITEASRLAVLSMVPLGPPRSDISSAMMVLSFKPAWDDPFVNSTNETVTWAERWTPPVEGNAPLSSFEPARIAAGADWWTSIWGGSEPAIPDFAAGPFMGARNETVIWAERWTSPGLSYRPAYSAESVTLPGGTPNPLVYANWQTGISATGTPAIPGFAVQKIGLKIGNEDESPSPVWCYFSSKEHEALNPTTFPLNDSRPRIWLVNATITRWDANP